MENAYFSYGGTVPFVSVSFLSGSGAGSPFPYSLGAALPGSGISWSLYVTAALCPSLARLEFSACGTAATFSSFVSALTGTFNGAHSLCLGFVSLTSEVVWSLLGFLLITVFVPPWRGLSE